MKATCSICGEVFKTTGVYNGHYQVRLHTKEKHPIEFAVIEAGEARAREIMNALYRAFGSAVKRVNQL